MNRAATWSKLCLSLGVRTAQVFVVSSVLGSAEGERWQAGPRFSPRHNLLTVDSKVAWNPESYLKETGLCSVRRTE
jgi:hypothetical protein